MKKQASCPIPKKLCRYDQGILDVGMTKEDRVELVKTHCFTRKHATGKAKIELHVLQVWIINNQAKYDTTGMPNLRQFDKCCIFSALRSNEV